MSGNGKIMCNHGVNLFKCQACIDAFVAEQIEKQEQRITGLEQQLKTAKADGMSEVIGTLRLRFQSGNEIPVERAVITRQEFEALEQQLKVSEGRVLDKPAKVGSGNFGVGIQWSTVIKAAQRHYAWCKAEQEEKLLDRRSDQYAKKLEGK